MVRVRRFLLISRQAAGRYRLLQFWGREEERETTGGWGSWGCERGSGETETASRERGDKTWHRESEKQRDEEKGRGWRGREDEESERVRDFERGGKDGRFVGRPGQRYCRTRRTCTSRAITREQGGRGMKRGWWVQNVRGCRECTTNTPKKYPSTRVHTSFSGSRRESRMEIDRGKTEKDGGR